MVPTRVLLLVALPLVAGACAETNNLPASPPKVGPAVIPASGGAAPSGSDGPAPSPSAAAASPPSAPSPGDTAPPPVASSPPRPTASPAPAASAPPSPATKPPPPDWLKPGAKLAYQVSTSGRRYSYSFVVTQLAPVRFDWQMGPPLNTSGSRGMSEHALEEARKQSNFFQRGESVVLEDTASVWLSRRCFAELKTQGRTTLSIDDQPEATFTKQGTVQVPVRLAGRAATLEALSAKADAGTAGAEIVVLDHAVHPIILRQHLRLGPVSLEVTIDTID